MKPIFHVVVILVVTGIISNCCLKKQSVGQSWQVNQLFTEKALGRQAKENSINGDTLFKDSLDTANQHNDMPVVLDLLYADPANQDNGISWLSVGHIL